MFVEISFIIDEHSNFQKHFIFDRNKDENNINNQTPQLISFHQLHNFYKNKQYEDIIVSGAYLNVEEDSYALVQTDFVLNNVEEYQLNPNDKYYIVDIVTVNNEPICCIILNNYDVSIIGRRENKLEPMVIAYQPHKLQLDVAYMKGFLPKTSNVKVNVYHIDGQYLINNIGKFYTVTFKTLLIGQVLPYVTIFSKDFNNGILVLGQHK